MSLNLAPGVTVEVDPPDLPEIRAEPPSSTVAVVPVAGPAGPIGEDGPPGPAGPPGGAYFRHNQIIPASVVTIEHGFGRWPAAITLTSLDGSIAFAVFGVEMIDLDTIRISIDQPTAYVALIS